MPVRTQRRMTGAIVLASVVTAVPLVAAEAVPGREVSFRFESSRVRANTGAAHMKVRVVTANGGALHLVGGRGRGTAVAFPRYRATGEPRAVITTVDPGGKDDLSPGNANFIFGADVRLDSRSEGSATDNGNNLFQRGFTHAAMQYKIQLDHNRPSCRVRGSAGAVAVVGRTLH